ncbi:IS607 family element RNA-guided endonuclease TnpB [Micromonospora sp. NBC_00858]|nr:IS607 family element RNA-guided endonuclease TnpB [Micromonospora sp. NBC_00858]
MIVNQAYRFALDPNASQMAALASHVGASRKAFNWALGLVKAQMDQRAAEKTYGLTGDQLTPSVSWTLPSLRKAWNEAKGDVAPWWAENSKEAYAAGIRNLVRGLDAWRDSKSGKRKGPKVNFPCFKNKRSETKSCTFTTGVIRVEPDRKHVALPRLGTIKLHESARKLARRLEAGTARILSATVKLDGGRWYVSFSCEVDRQIADHARSDAVVGVDVGIKHLAVLSTGDVIDNPRHLAGGAKHLRRLSRRVSRRVGPGPTHRPGGIQALAEGQRGPVPGIRPGGEPAPRRPTQAHLRADRRLCHDRGGRPERCRDGPQPQASQGHLRLRVRHDPRLAGLQDNVERWSAGHRRPLVPIEQDLFGLRRSESQAAAASPDLRV